MSDKTSQIIDLGEALKRSMNERSTGEVAAPDVSVCRIADGWTDPRSVGDVPLVENECCKCRTKLLRRGKSDSYICDDCFDILQSDGGEEALAVKLERAATVKYLRELSDINTREGWETDEGCRALAFAAERIEKGRHVP